MIPYLVSLKYSCPALLGSVVTSSTMFMFQLITPCTAWMKILVTFGQSRACWKVIHLKFRMHLVTRLNIKQNLKTEHEGVEVVNLLGMQRVVAHVHVVVGVPVELGHPDGKIELLPEQVHVALNPGK